MRAARSGCARARAGRLYVSLRMAPYCLGLFLQHSWTGFVPYRELAPGAASSPPLPAAFSAPLSGRDVPRTAPRLKRGAAMFRAGVAGVAGAAIISSLTAGILPSYAACGLSLARQPSLSCLARAILCVYMLAAHPPLPLMVTWWAWAHGHSAAGCFSLVSVSRVCAVFLAFLCRAWTWGG